MTSEQDGSFRPSDLVVNVTEEAEAWADAAAAEAEASVATLASDQVLAETRIMVSTTGKRRLSVLVVKERIPPGDALGGRASFQFCGHLHRTDQAARDCETVQRRILKEHGCHVV